MTPFSSGDPARLDALESRTLFSTYLFQGIGDAFELGRAIVDLPAPGGAVGFGAAVAGLGDINDDGRSDFAVAAPGDATGMPGGAAGSVFIYSGDGTLIRTLTDAAPGFGISLTSVGDLNDDGVPDLLIGSPWNDASADAVHNPMGSAYLYSGADGALLRTIQGTRELGEFGRVVARTTDFDNDGLLDFAVSAPAGGDAGAGQVRVFAGFDASVLRTFDGTQVGERFGEALGTNIIGPGANEPAIVIGAPNRDNDTGRVYLYGLAGALIRSVDGAEIGERYGAATALVLQRNFNLNTSLTILVGAPGADDYRGQFGQFVVENRGRIDQFSASTSIDAFAQFIGNFTNERLGETISNAGQLTKDGVDDFIITAPGNATTPVQYLVSTEGVQWNVRQRPQTEFYTTPLDLLNGSAFASAGDVNNDGVNDVISGTAAEGGRVTIVSALGLGDAITVQGASPDHSYVWGQTGELSVLFANGALTPFSRIPGLTPLPPAGDITTPYSHVEGILNDGTIIFFDQPRNNTLDRTELMLLNNGTAVPLSTLVTSVNGTTDAPDYTALNVAEVGANGHLALIGADDRVWMYHAGVLNFAWSGRVYDINGLGAIVGIRSDNTPVTWSLEDGAVDIEGLDVPGAINDLGQVVGTITGTRNFGNPGTIGLWQDGVVTEVAQGPDIFNGASGGPWWVYRDLDNTGRVLVDISIPGIRTAVLSRNTYLFEPETGLRELGEVPFGIPTQQWFAGYSFLPPPANVTIDMLPIVSFGSDGSILAHNAFLTQIDDALPFTLREGTPVANVGANGVNHMVGVNIYGDVVAFSDNGGTWSGRRLTGGIRPGDMIGLAATTDPMDDNTPYAIVAVGDQLLVFRLIPMEGVGALPNQGSIKGFSDQTAIVSGLTVFTNTEGVVHVAGVDVNGDAVIYFRSTTFLFTSANGWTYDNLSRTHLQPQGLATPAFVGGLSAFSTPWQGMNINGIDADGNVHSIWWAPGQVFWSVTNLTEAADAGPLHGEITSFATAWGTLHVNGIDADGEITAIWWAAGFGGAWRHDKLLPGGVALDPASLTSFTTPWGGLNIGGRDAMTGQVVVYWWSPESNVWTDEHLEFVDGLASPTLRGKLSSNVSPDGVMSIAAQGDDATAYRMKWQPGDDLWTLQDLTDLAS